MVAETTQPIANNFSNMEENVRQYLLNHPDFFNRHSDLSQQISIPHPIHGAISLLEWQIAKQREAITQLQDQIHFLTENAANNQKLIDELMTLKSQIWQANSLIDLMKYIDNWAKSLNLVGASLYLLEDKWELSSFAIDEKFILKQPDFEHIRGNYFKNNQQYLGQLDSVSSNLLLPKLAQKGSVAMSLIGNVSDLGLIVFSSHHAKHYQAGQGTLLLEKIAEILPIFIEKWIQRKNE